MCDGCVTEFTTYFGTGLLGMWIKWSNTAATNDATTALADDPVLTIDFDLRLYAADLTSQSGGVLENTQTLEYYTLWTNPYADGTTNEGASEYNMDQTNVAIMGIVDN